MDVMGQDAAASSGRKISAAQQLKVLEEALNNALLQLKADIGSSPDQQAGKTADKSGSGQEGGKGESGSNGSGSGSSVSMAAARRNSERHSKHHVTSVDLPLSAAQHRLRRKQHIDALSTVEKARPLVFQHERYRTARSLTYSATFKPDDLHHILKEVCACARVCACACACACVCVCRLVRLCTKLSLNPS